MIDASEALSHWASLARPDLKSEEDSSCHGPPSFERAFSILIETSKALRKLQEHEIKSILLRSGEMFSLFGEPLTKDLGLASFLADEREEAYSRWLQWAFSRMTPQELTSILSLPHLAEYCDGSSGCRLIVRREVRVNHGHEGKSGRLDLLIEVGDSAVVVIEVKVGPPSNTEKQDGYVRSLTDDPTFAQRKHFHLLLVTLSDQEVFHGFEVRRYAPLCRNLRRLAVQWLAPDRPVSDTGPMEAALLLAVCAAIETNLLGLSAGQLLSRTATISYLQHFVEDAAYESN